MILGIFSQLWGGRVGVSFYGIITIETPNRIASRNIIIGKGMRS